MCREMFKFLIGSKAGVRGELPAPRRCLLAAVCSPGARAVCASVAHLRSAMMSGTSPPIMLFRPPMLFSPLPVRFT